MTDPSSFAKLVPGFDFLQGLVKNAGAALPGIGQWVAPTIDPVELEKRIEELRTVQFWLEQNARMLGATIQALEVQRMTLSTLKTMNVQMEDLRDSLQVRLPDPPPARDPASAPAVPAGTPDGPPDVSAAPGAPAPGVDPLQWWGALTKQFTELATNAMTGTAAEAARTLAATRVTPKPDTSSPKSARQATARAPARTRAAPAAAKPAAPRKKTGAAR